MPTKKDIWSKRPNVTAAAGTSAKIGALRGRKYGEPNGITWQSAGNRYGRLLGQHDTKTKNALYELLVTLHTAEWIDLE